MAAVKSNVSSKTEIDESSFALKDYSFYRALRKLESKIASDDKKSRSFINEPFLFRANNSLAFPVSDIDQIDKITTSEGASKLRLSVNFLGLYGSGSPLPVHYSEDLLGLDDNENTTRHFLDIFHHAMFRSLYEIWKKYRLFERNDELKEKNVDDYLLRYVGTDARELSSRGIVIGDFRPLIPLLINEDVSKKNLEKILSVFLGGEAVCIEESITTRLDLAPVDRNRLGAKHCSLGVSTVLGSRMEDSDSKINISIGPIDNKRFESIRRGTVGYESLIALIDTVLKDSVEYDVDIKIESSEISPVVLSKQDGKLLGNTSWLGKGKPGTITVKQNK